MWRVLVLVLFTSPALAQDAVAPAPPKTECEHLDGSSRFYFDGDGDGFGRPGSVCFNEAKGRFTATNNLDADDTDDTIHTVLPKPKRRRFWVRRARK